MSKADALAWIAEKGGVVLERKEPGDKTVHVWVRCAAGHEWRAIYSNLARHHWCAACYGNSRHTIELMRNIAASRGGKCLSEEYTGVHGHL